LFMKKWGRIKINGRILFLRGGGGMVIGCYKTWVFRQDRERKRQSSQWIKPVSDTHTHTHTHTQSAKCRSYADKPFFDVRGVIYTLRICPVKRVVSQTFYLQLLVVLCDAAFSVKQLLA
jgi:hypothetical protein